jgi:hypothetical protein
MTTDRQPRDFLSRRFQQFIDAELAGELAPGTAAKVLRMPGADLELLRTDSAQSEVGVVIKRAGRRIARLDIDASIYTDDLAHELLELVRRRVT